MLTFWTCKPLSVCVATASGDAARCRRLCLCCDVADTLCWRGRVAHACQQKLHRDLDLQSALANDSTQSLEYVGGQVEALRNAYSTLSDVMVDELGACATQCYYRLRLAVAGGQAPCPRVTCSCAPACPCVSHACVPLLTEAVRTETRALRRELQARSSVSAGSAC